MVDVLSDAVTAMRTGRPHCARAHRTQSFGRRFPAIDGAGFHIVLHGSCRLLPPEGAPIALEAGDVAFLPHGAAHGLSGAATVMLCGAYLLDRSRVHPLLRDLPDVLHLPTPDGRHSHLRAAIDLLGGELEQPQPRPGGEAMLTALLDLLFVYVLRARFDEETANGNTTGWAAALRDPAVASALRAIHGDPGRHWTVGELGANAGLSRAAFARRFAALVGRPPLAYLTWWRMTTAARLLRESDAPLAAVARKVGYTSEFAFAHAFKREYGSAPGGFRQSGPSKTVAGKLRPPADRGPRPSIR